MCFYFVKYELILYLSFLQNTHKLVSFTVNDEIVCPFFSIIFKNH